LKNKESKYLALSKKLADQFKVLPQVQAIALGGSIAKGFTDKFSDIDLYVFSNELVPLSSRKEIVDLFEVTRADLNLTFWDLGDEWVDKETGIEIDVIYWDRTWISDQIDRVFIEHRASVGYSTCFWHTILNAIPLFDRDDWFLDLQKKCDRAYPEKLRDAIIAKNHPVLRNIIPSYYYQIQKALERRDQISINHRIAAYLASYFDILFAVNKLPNPGEKKILSFALEYCEKKPENLKVQIEDVLNLSGNGTSELLDSLTQLIDALDQILLDEGINPADTLTLDKQS